MERIGLDMHQRERQLAIKADDGTITDRRIVTSRERFTAVFGQRPRAKMLVEARTEREWVARHLESLGHEVIVADPNDAPMYADRSRRTKTDQRDAWTLVDARGCSRMLVDARGCVQDGRVSSRAPVVGGATGSSRS